ncbi:hypothetical protein ACQRIU_006988 [Beauveria bassiana]
MQSDSPSKDETKLSHCPTTPLLSFLATPAPSSRSATPLPDPEHQYLWRCFPDHTWSQRVRDTSSWVWDFGYDVQNFDGNRRWVCKPCVRIKSPRPRSFAEKGIQNANAHLFRDHGICAPDEGTKSSAQKRAEKVKAKQRSIAEVMKLDTRLPREQDIANSLVQGFDRKHFQRLLLEWIVEENHSFRVCEQGRLRRIFEYLNPLVKITDANISRTTIRRQVLASYEAHKDKVAAVLQKSPGLIHVSFDGWKSGNRHSLYGVTCFFRDENSKPCKLLYMIRRAIILRPFLEQLVLKHRQQWEQENRSKRTGGIRKSAKEPRICMEENQLMSNDWIVLEQLAKLLGFYEDAVRTLEGDGQLRRRKRGWVGSYGNIWEVIQGFKFLLEVLEKYKQLAYGIPNSEHLRININLG